MKMNQFEAITSLLILSVENYSEICEKHKISHSYLSTSSHSVIGFVTLVPEWMRLHCVLVYIVTSFM